MLAGGANTPRASITLWRGVAGKALTPAPVGWRAELAVDDELEHDEQGEEGDGRDHKSKVGSPVAKLEGEILAEERIRLLPKPRARVRARLMLTTTIWISSFVVVLFFIVSLLFPFDRSVHTLHTTHASHTSSSFFFFVKKFF